MSSRKCRGENFGFFVDGRVPVVFDDEIAVANAKIDNAISIHRAECCFSVVQYAKYG